MKPKLLFVYEHKYPRYWLDGLYGALQLLEETYEIEYWNLFEKPYLELNKAVDMVLGWGAFGSSVDQVLQGSSYPKQGLCIAGNATEPTGALHYNVLFYETKFYRPFISFHENIIQAFGVNTDIFGPLDMPMPIVWDYIGVGAFATWKRWDKMLNKKGHRFVIGEYQKDNEEESGELVKKLVREGVMVSHLVNPFDLSNFYHWSRTLYMPADLNGGGERAILEARSCGLRIEIEEDNPKLKEVAEWLPIPDHHWYAKQLQIGLKTLL